MIKKVKNIIYFLAPKSRFSRDVGMLGGGVGIAQLILLLAALPLSRLYSPEDFGILSVYVGIVTVLGVISSLRYELAIPLPKDDKDAINLVVLCLILLLASSAIVSILVLLFGKSIAAVLGIKNPSNYFWAIPLGVLTYGVYTVFSYWSIRKSAFIIVAATRMKQTIVMLTIHFLGFKLGGEGLILGQLVGQGAGVTSLAQLVLKTKKLKLVSIIGIKNAIIRYKCFFIFSTLASLINTLGHQMIPMIFSAVFSVKIAGLYALSHRILSVPSTFLGSALSQAFLGHGSDAYRKNKFNDMYLRLQNVLFQVGLPPVITVILFGPRLFEFFFGENWSQAGVFSQWLSLSVFMGFIVSPLSQAFIILEKQKAGFFLQLLLFISRLTGICIGCWLKDSNLVVVLFSLGSLLGYSFYLIFGATYVGINLMKLFLSLVFYFLRTIVLFFPVIIAMHFDIDCIFYMSSLITGALILFRYWKIYTLEHVI